MRPVSAAQPGGGAGTARFDVAGTARAELDYAWRRFGGADNPEEFCQSWLELQCELIGGVKDAVVVLQKPGVETFAPLAFWPEGKRDRSHLVEISERALREGRGMLEPRTAGPVSLAQRPRSFPTISSPIQCASRARCAAWSRSSFRGATRSQLQAGMRQLQWGAGWLEVLLRRYADPMEAARLRVKIMLQLVAAFLEQGEYRDAATALVTEIASRLGCDRVVLAALERGALHIEAVSHAAQFDRHANLLGATIAAMTESLDQREPVVYPLEQSRRLAVTLSHAQLAQASGAGGVATFPLVHGGRQVGALTLERAAGFAFDAPTLELLEGLAAMLAPLVDLRRTRDRGLAAHAADAGRELATRVAGPGHAGTKLGLLLMAATRPVPDGEHRHLPRVRRRAHRRRGAARDHRAVPGLRARGRRARRRRRAPGAGARAPRRPRPQGGARAALRAARAARPAIPRRHVAPGALAGAHHECADRAVRGAARAARGAARAHRSDRAVRRRGGERRSFASRSARRSSAAR